jgi:L-ascorbate metabolism protein UlaG (beta-lactamase superfamily)
MAKGGLPLGALAYIDFAWGSLSLITGLVGFVFSIRKLLYSEKEYTLSNHRKTLIQPVQKVFCWAKRFVHGEQDTRNPLWDTVQNISLMREGGFRKYPPLPEQLPELWGPTPFTAMTDKVRLRWLGHASFLIEVRLDDGRTTTLLTDPNWSETIPFMGPIPLYYRSLGPLPFDNMPLIDVILLSHTHRDHFDPPTLQRFEDRDHPKICCPLNAGSLLKGFTDVQECSWWDKIILPNDVEITYLPSDHASQTTAFDCNEYLWGGYMVSIPIGESKYHIYFMGDSACNMDPSIPGFRPELWDFDSQVFNNIATQFPQIDCMLYQTDPVYGEEDKHCNVKQGIELMKKLNPRLIIPMHCEIWPFNTFGRDLLGPVRVLKQTLKEESEELYSRLYHMKVGEEISLVSNQ